MIQRAVRMEVGRSSVGLVWFGLVWFRLVALTFGLHVAYDNYSFILRFGFEGTVCCGFIFYWLQVPLLCWCLQLWVGGYVRLRQDCLY